jgi:hypothetical protein
MKLQEVFDQLTHGELSQIAIGGVANGEILESNYPHVVSHVNMGLNTLYSRFNLKEGRLILEPVTGQTRYPLTSRYAVNGKPVAETNKYIIDTVNAPFVDDIIKINRVLTDDALEFGLNDSSDIYSCFTPQSNILVIPGGLVGDDLEMPIQYQTAKLNLVYQAKHFHLNADTNASDPGTLELELPYTHLWALLLFVASRVNNPIGMSNEFNAGNNYAAKFEMECQNLEKNGMEIDQGSSGSKLRDRGFV